MSALIKSVLLLGMASIVSCGSIPAPNRIPSDGIRSYTPKAHHRRHPMPPVNVTVPPEAILRCELIQMSACPSQLKDGSYPCISSFEMCNGIADCPLGEDEAGTYCMFYKLQDNEISKMRDVVVRMFSAFDRRARNNGNGDGF